MIRLLTIIALIALVLVPRRSSAPRAEDDAQPGRALSEETAETEIRESEVASV